MPRKRTVPVKGVHAGGAAWLQLHSSIAAYALDLMCSRGYGSLTIDNLAATSGINRRTIYRHYPELADLAVAAVKQMPPLDKGWEDGGSPREKLEAAARVASDHPGRLPRLLATAITHDEDEPRLLKAVVDFVLEPRQQAIAARIEEGQRDGWARTEVEGWEIAALINGVLIEESLGLLKFPSKQARGQALADSIWRMIAVDPDGDGRPKSAKPRGSAG